MHTSKVRAPEPVVKTQRPPTWSQVPHDALEAVAAGLLIPTDLVLLAALLRFARAGATCWPSVATLAAAIGRKRRATQLRLRHLEARGWIASRPAINPTGREIVLLWREGAQAEAPAPRKGPAAAPRHQIAPEYKTAEKKGPASSSSPVRTGTTPPGNEIGDRPATPDDWRELRRLRYPGPPAKLADALGRLRRVY